VNSLVAGDQEDAQVSVLNKRRSGFCVAGWQTRFPTYLFRFLSPSNSWLTGDVQVNTSNNRFQNGLAMATLLNGNVAVVYGSVNQAAPGSMMDVYFQILTPNGNKIAVKFRSINLPP